MSSVGTNSPPITSRPSNSLFRAIQPYTFAFRAIRAVAGAQPVVDLRPEMAALGMSIRNQGARPTCSVHAVTCLLEFMYGGHMEAMATNLSEEYLNYVSDLAVGEVKDGGFFWALDDGYRADGIVPEAMAPYQSTPMSNIDASVREQGRRWPRLAADFIKPWDKTKGASPQQLERAVDYLNRRIPVAFGGWWPESSLATTTEIMGVDVMDVPPASEKEKGLFDGHSVVLVGYGKHATFPGGGYFIFRNSWRQGWGDMGYGYMPFGYVLNFANDLMAYHLAGFKGKALSLQAVAARPNRLSLVAADTSGKIATAAWQTDKVAGRWRAWWDVRNGKTKAGGPVTLLSRQDGQADAFVTGTDGNVFTAAWNRSEHDGLWQGWWRIGQAPSAPGYPISAVARKADRLDVFLAGKDGRVYTAAWDPSQAGGQWRGWWQVGNLTAKKGAWISAVSRRPHQIDLFTVTEVGAIHTAAWDANVDGGKWRGWWPVQSGVAGPGSMVTAVSRHPDQIDLYTVGTDGAIWTAAWNQHQNDGKWRGWWKVLEGRAMTGSSVAAVARKPDQLDVFVIGLDGGVWTAAWNANQAGGKWQGWWRIRDGVAAPGSGIAAVTRSPDHLDVFVVGQDGGIWTAAWAQGLANRQWQGWWKVAS